MKAEYYLIYLIYITHHSNKEAFKRIKHIPLFDYLIFELMRAVDTNNVAYMGSY